MVDDERRVETARFLRLLCLIPTFIGMLLLFNVMFLSVAIMIVGSIYCAIDGWIIPRLCGLKPSSRVISLTFWDDYNVAKQKYHPWLEIASLGSLFFLFLVPFVFGHRNIPDVDTMLFWALFLSLLSWGSARRLLAFRRLLNKPVVG